MVYTGKRGGVIINVVADTRRLRRQLGGLNWKTLFKGMALGVPLTGLASIGGALTGGFQLAASLDEKLRQVFTLLNNTPEAGSNAWKLMLEDMTEQTGDLAVKYGILADEIAEAAYQAISAGVPVEDLWTFLDTAAKGAVAGGTEITGVVDGLTTLLNVYREARFEEDVLTADEAMNILFTTIRLGKTRYSELNASMSDTVVAAKEVGISFEEAAAGMAALTAAGVPTSQAATQMRAFLLEFADPSKKASKNFAEAAGQSWSDFVEGGGELDEALKMMRQFAEEQETTMAALFSRHEGGLGAALLSDSPLFTKALAEMKDSVGETDRAFDIMADSGQFHMNRLRTSWNDLLRDLGRDFAPGILKIFKTITTTINKKEVRETVEDVADKAKKTAKSVWDILAGANKSLVQLKTSLKDPEFWKFAGEESGIAGFWSDLWGDITAFAPEGLFKNFGESIKNMLKSIFGDSSPTRWRIVNFFIWFGKEAWNSLKYIAGLFGLDHLGTWILDGFKAAWDWFSTDFWLTVSNEGKGWLNPDGYRRLGELLSEHIGTMIKVVAGVLLTPFTALWMGLTTVLGPVWDEFGKPILQEIGSEIADLVLGFGDAFVGFGEWLKNFWDETLKPALRTMGSLFWSLMGEPFVNTMKDMWGGIKQFGEKLGEFLTGPLEQVINFWIDSFNVLVRGFNLLVKGWNAAQNVLPDFLGGGKTINEVNLLERVNIANPAVDIADWVVPERPTPEMALAGTQNAVDNSVHVMINGHVFTFDSTEFQDMVGKAIQNDVRQNGVPQYLRPGYNT